MSVDSISITEEAVVPKKKKKAGKENLKQRAYLNSLSSIIDYGGAQITGFIVNPFIVSGLGSSMYGIWQVLGQMTGYTKMADTRATQVLKWSLANKRDVGHEEEFKSDVTTALIVTMISMPISLLVGGIISWYAPYITQADPKYFSLIRITCSILILSLVVNKIFDLFEAVLGGMNLGYKRMGFRACLVAVGGILKVIAITSGYGLIGLAVIQIFITIITGVTFYFIVKKAVPWFAFGKTDRSKVKSFGKLSGWFMAFSTIKMFLLSSDKILLGYIVGPILVSNYTLTMFTSTAIQGGLVAIITGMTPGICSLFGKGEYEKVKKARTTIISLVWLFTAAVGSALLLTNKGFIGLWVGAEHYAGNFENLLILMVSVQVVFFQLDSFIINATLDMNKKVYLSAAASVVSIVLSFLLVGKFHIIGLCFSILIGRMFYSVGFPMMLKKRMMDDTPIVSLKSFRPFAVAMVLFFVTTYLGGSFIHIPNWFALLGIGTVTLLISGFIFWFVGLNADDRVHTKKAMSGIKMLKMK